MRTRNHILTCAVALLCLACSPKEVDSDAAYQRAMAAGVAALEIDDAPAAVTAFTRAAGFKPQACEPQVGLTLGHTLGLLATIRDFNDLLFPGRAPDPDSLDVLSDKGGLIDTLLANPLLIPALDALEGMAAAADRVGDAPCSLDVRLPVKVAFGTTVNLNLRIGDRWSGLEAGLLGGAAGILLAVDHLLLAHDVEVPALTALGLMEKLDRRDPVSFARRLGMVPGSAKRFLDWHNNPERRALFGEIPLVLARALRTLGRVADAADSYLTAMPKWTEDEVIWIRDFDDSASMTTGDTLVIRIEGKLAVGSDGTRGLNGLEFNVGPTVRPDVLNLTTSFLAESARVFAGEATPGTRLKLDSLNGFFEVFGQARPFEDVLEVDPLAFFRGAPTTGDWRRRDLNGNCTAAEGAEALCTCIPARSITHPETGEIVEVRVPTDIVLLPDGAEITAPTEACLREGLEIVGAAYPDPPAPRPLRTVLPYWFRDPLIPESVDVFGIEGEKSANLLAGISVPPWINYGDFDHFLFGVVSTDVGPVDLRLPADCVSPPDEDRFGFITLPYAAWRDPTFGGSVFVNLSILTGGDCGDGHEPTYRTWAPANLYGVNKVIAHYAARYGRLLYDVFAFLVL